VIPTYNRARDLDRALSSIQAQTFADWEVLVVDDHSTDNTDDVVLSRKDARIKLLKVKVKGVIAASRNHGIRQAEGEYIAFLDSDDWWMPEKLAESLKYLEQGADVVYHDMYIATKPNQRLFWRKDPARDVNVPVFDDLIRHGNALKTSSVVMRKSILEQIGGQSEDVELKAAEDYDAWVRSSRVTDRFKRIPKTLGYYWMGNGNTTNPARTLRLLEKLEDIYANEMKAVHNGGRLSWIEYSKARACYRLGRYASARGHVKALCWRDVGLISSLKVIWMLVMLTCWHRKSAYTTKPRAEGLNLR